MSIRRKSHEQRILRAQCFLGDGSKLGEIREEEVMSGDFLVEGASKQEVSRWS